MIQTNPPTGGSPSDGHAEIVWQLRNWRKPHKRGKVFGANGGFYLRDGSLLSPDAAHGLPESLRGASKAEMTGFPHLCPDFVIELLSATDNLARTQQKMERWIENGAKLDLRVDPYARRVHVYAAGAEAAVLDGTSVAGVGPVEGCVLDLGEVWGCYEL